MITNCPVCGKCFDVLWPHLWRYKRNHSYICSWTCLRLIDSKRKKEGLIVNNPSDKRPRMSPADMKKAVEMFRNGDEGLEQFLRDHGITNIYKWKYNTRMRYGIEPAAPEQVATVKVDGPIRIETKEPEKIELVGRDYDIVAMEEELKFNERTTVTAIRVEGLGEFYFDKKYNSVDWRAESGDEVSLGPAWWIQLVEDLPLILKKLGVKL